MKGLELPALGVLNSFLIGDTVLCEPIARELGASVDKTAYVISNFPEIYHGHPIVSGVRGYEEMPEGSRVIDLTDSISGIKTDKDGELYVEEHKFLNMCKQAGFQRSLDRPKLYLTPLEWSDAQEMRKFFPDRPNVGVVLGSAHVAKNWIYVKPAIKKLVKAGYNVFVIGAAIDETDELKIPNGAYRIVGRSLREAMIYIAMMDVMVGPDTGPMHIAGALNIPLVVICFSMFADLYEMYDKAIILDSNNFTLEKGIRGVSIKSVISSVNELVGVDKKAPVIEVMDEPVMQPKSHAFVRMRGLGDVILSLPAIATMRSMNGNASQKYTYITTPAAKSILECTDLLDDIIPVNYKHSHAGYPLPPPDVDYSKFDSVVNLINRIDFVPSSSTTPRTELFAKEMGIDKCDYSASGWKLSPPKEWIYDIWNLLMSYGLRPEHRIMGLQTDTKGASRNWPKARQIEFCGKAMKKGWKVVLISDQHRAKYPHDCINLTGELSLKQYIALIKVLSILVCPDSSGVHLAGAMDVPAIGLFGAVDPKLRVSHYDSVRTIVGKAKYCRRLDGSHKFCNDWQSRSCSHKKRVPECMWGIKAKHVMKEVEKYWKDLKESDDAR